MAKLNIANMNTLFRKGYLLAGVMMAANMFVVNEIKAMEAPTKEENDPEKNKELNTKIDSSLKITNINEIEKIGTETQKKNDVPGTNIFEKVLSYENIINLFGGLAFSCVNNYFKWWDYNPCWYGQFGCFGWKSKRFLYDVVQFEFNFNLGRGALWSFIHIMNRIKTSGESEKDDSFPWISFFLKDILRGFTSMPLTFHISNFSISLSLDSIIWWGIIDHFILKPSGEKEVKKGEEPKKEGDGPISIENIENNNIDYNLNNKPKENESNTNPDNA